MSKRSFYENYFLAYRSGAWCQETGKNLFMSGHNNNADFSIICLKNSDGNMLSAWFIRLWYSFFLPENTVFNLSVQTVCGISQSAQHSVRPNTPGTSIPGIFWQNLRSHLTWLPKVFFSPHKMRAGTLNGIVKVSVLRKRKRRPSTLIYYRNLK